MTEEFTFNEARRHYHFATDAVNIIRTIVDRELKSLYEGHLIVLFIDCYDLISFLFPKDMLTPDSHYAWNRFIWTEAFDTLHGSDNIKISISPPSCLELFHFLERKAYYVYKGTPTLKKEDEKDWDSFWRKLLPNMDAYSLTENLIDNASGTVPYLLKLKDLVVARKVVNACNVFDYSRGNWGEVEGIVAPQFDLKGAEEFLRKQRRRYIARKKKNKLPDLSQVGLNKFSVSVDISNIAQTTYINQICEDKLFTFASHGVNLILCVHKRSGFWRGDKEAPVLNSLSALFLSRALRGFKSYKEAQEFYMGTLFAFQNYLFEFVQLFKPCPQLEHYIYSPQKYAGLADTLLTKPKALKKAEDYISDYSGHCLSGSMGALLKKTQVGPTGVKVSEVLEFAKDEKLRREKGEKLLEAARRSFLATEIFSPEGISKVYYPPSDVDTTNQLLLKLSGYTFSDWEK